MNLPGSWVGRGESKPSNLSPWSLLWTAVGSSSVGFRVRLLGVYPSSPTHSVTLGKPLNLSASWFLLLEKIMTPAISDSSCCIINPFQNFVAAEPLWLAGFSWAVLVVAQFTHTPCLAGRLLGGSASRENLPVPTLCLFGMWSLILQQVTPSIVSQQRPNREKARPLEI